MILPIEHGRSINVWTVVIVNALWYRDEIDTDNYTEAVELLLETVHCLLAEGIKWDDIRYNLYIESLNCYLKPTYIRTADMIVNGIKNNSYGGASQYVGGRSFENC